MRKTKIVCTLGPSTDREEVLRDMILSGMNVARFNFSHGNYDEHRRRLDALKKIRTELGVPVAALLDTKGPEIRLKQFAGGKTHLKTGQTFTLTTREVEGSAEVCSITYKDLPGDLAVGSTVLLADGLISMTVTSLSDTDIQCRVDNGGPISNNKGVNVPGVRLSMPYMSQRDKDDILFGIEQGFDFVAASFTRSAQDIQEIRRLLNAGDSKMRIIAKIENREGVDNIDEILAAADAVMIARGDMGVEIDFTEIPVIQKEIIAQCVACGKPVITATQMLDSMIEHPRPTRAEITDVANAIYDGTSAIMLSGETAAGKYPVEAIRTMDAIAQRTEADINYSKRMQNISNQGRISIAAATAHAACTTAMDIRADAILTVSKSGTTARLVSRFRPGTTVAALLMDPQVQRQMALYWG
ncbi:pyruvate kinase, partial [Allofournierella sp.]|uniref:pyruvate kinase n=1 Tax=Allofournierella sp. TaxID=1940256 RepID=UPI003AB47D15